MSCCVYVISGFYLSFSSLYSLLHVLLLYFLFCNCIYEVFFVASRVLPDCIYISLKYLYLFKFATLISSPNHMHFFSCFLPAFFSSDHVFASLKTNMSLAFYNVANSFCDLRALWVSLFCSRILVSTERFC